MFIDLTFDIRNNSLCIGDYVKRIDTSTNGNFIQTSGAETEMGRVTAIRYTDANGSAIAGMRVTVNVSDSYSHEAGDFIFFSKDSRIEQSSLSGYYLSLKFQNNSTSQAELFSVGCEVAQSSK